MWVQGSNLADPLDAVSRGSIWWDPTLRRCVQQGRQLDYYPTNTVHAGPVLSYVFVLCAHVWPDGGRACGGVSGRRRTPVLLMIFDDYDYDAPRRLSGDSLTAAVGLE